MSHFIRDSETNQPLEPNPINNTTFQIRQLSSWFHGRDANLKSLLTRRINVCCSFDGGQIILHKTAKSDPYLTVSMVKHFYFYAPGF